MSQNLEIEESQYNSIPDLTSDIKKSILGMDLAFNFGSLIKQQHILMPKNTIPNINIITDSLTSIKNIVPDFAKPSVLDTITGKFPYYFQSPLTEFAKGQRQIETIIGPSTIAFAKALTKYQDYANPLTETFKGISSWANSYQVATKNLVPIFGAVDSIKHMTELFTPPKNFITSSTLALLGNIKASNAAIHTFPWNNVYPDEYFKSPTIGRGIEELTEGIYNYLRQNKVEVNEDESTIADGISLAVNMDMQNSSDANFDVTEFIASLTNFFKDSYSLPGEKLTAAINDIKQKYGSIAIYLIVMMFSYVGEKVLDKGYEVVSNLIIDSAENPTNKIITIEDKLLKSKPDGRSITIDIIPAKTPIMILHPDVKKWIFIQYVNSDGEVKQGWTLNKDLMY